MADFQVSSCAYVKMLLHAAKYPHNAVNGVLLAEKERADGKAWKVVDAIPLFHISLYLSPMAEIAMVHVDELAASRSLKVVGYYCAHENLNNNGIEGVPGVKVADKIAEHFPNACLLVINNQLVSKSADRPALNLWQNTEGRWVSRGEVQLEAKSATIDATAALLERGATKELYDFDNYLDNTECDWGNQHLNRDLNLLLSMY